MSDDVVMGYPIEGRPPGPYQPTPSLKALMTLAHVAGLTSRIGIGTEVLVSPGGRRSSRSKGAHSTRCRAAACGSASAGSRMRTKPSAGTFTPAAREWTRRSRCSARTGGDAHEDFEGTRYRATAMSMEPKPPHGRRLPLWIGGSSEAAYHRVGRFGDCRMGSRVSDAESSGRAIELKS
jgi:alkanesulfonate monooxygenase SsuD/methylene tetrahydromethanopterin reductase-like flavin-dependent oxidoreductase (luciferase family)